jgi:hypothetical protein
MTLRKAVYTVLGIGVVGVLLAIGTTSYTSVCGKCGLQRDSFAVFRLERHHLTPTPLSAAVEQSKLRVGHAHEWRYCAGANLMASCMIGPGRFLTGAVTSEHAAAYLRNLAEFEPKSVDLWLNALLGSQSDQARRMLDTFPEAGFSKREDFDAWRIKTIDGVEEWLRERS